MVQYNTPLFDVIDDADEVTPADIGMCKISDWSTCSAACGSGLELGLGQGQG